jgi:nicotinamide riboside transporter PnuC
MLGQTLTWIQMLAPFIGFVSIVLAVDKFVWGYIMEGQVIDRYFYSEKVAELELESKVETK